MMPSGGSADRAEAVGTLVQMQHEILTSSEFGDQLEVAQDGDLSVWQRANVRELGAERARALAVPSDLVLAMEKASVVCDQAWRINRPKNDWEGTKEQLREVFNLTRQQATCLSENLGLAPYDALMDGYEAGLRQAFVDPIFDRLEKELPALIDDAIANQRQPEPIAGEFTPDQQALGARRVSELLQFDFSRGRLDTSTHPFSSGVASDARLTTRYTDGKFTESTWATMHETGHALYTQGLPQEHSGSPVGHACGMMMHESQSLFMEMQVCRSNSFLRFILPHLAEVYQQSVGESAGWTLENFIAQIRQVRRSYIRVNADELTYPLHVILRYELEKKILSGDLDVDELPEAWDQAMQAKLSLSTVGNFKDGVMQDTHWFGGSVGYFPTYTLGALAAAQLFQAFVRNEGDPSSDFEHGKFENVLAWLRANIHSKGRLHPSMDLIEQSTGKPLAADDFLKHVKGRYTS